MDTKNLSIFPILDTVSWAYYKKAVSSFWTVEEIDLSKDLDDFKKLTKDERYFIENILSFFNSSDLIVNENLGLRFLNEPNITQEMKCFYGFQYAIENIHSETYSLLIDTLVKDREHKKFLQNGIINNQFIKNKAEWCYKYIDSNIDFIYRLIAFCCVEGIFFSSSFCSIYWLKKRGLLPGLTFSNELIARDESLHTEFGVNVFKQLGKHYKTSKLIIDIIKEASELEKQFVDYCLEVNLIGMNSVLMKQYVEFMTDRLCVQLGLDKIYESENPFDFMEMIALQGKTSFFEKRNSDYSKASIANSLEGSEGFNITDDF